MIPKYRICDKCKEGHVPQELSFFAATGRFTGPSGSAETEGENVDLCHACAVRAIRHLTSVNAGPSGGRRVPNYTLNDELCIWVFSD